MKTTAEAKAARERFGSCRMCGKRFPYGKRGTLRLYCSGACQARGWREDHPGEAYRQNVKAYLSMTEHERDQGRNRAKARQRALSTLATLHPRQYRQLYEAELKALTDNGC